MEAAPTRPVVSIVVVNYNGAAHLGPCLDAVFADSYPRKEVFVVDNASTDGSRRVLDEISVRHPELIVCLSPVNVGYAAAVNLAAARAAGTYLAALNMDVEVTDGWLDPLVEFLEAHPRAGAVNPLILLRDGRRINAAGHDVQVTGLGFTRHLGQLAQEANTAPSKVSGISGAAFVMSRALFHRIGGMDASGFLYHEDVNLAWLLQLAGYSLHCVPASVVRHDYRLSMYPGKLQLLERNRWVMLLAYLRPTTLVVLAPLLLLTELLTWAYCFGLGPPFVRAKLAAYRGVLRRRQSIRHGRRLARRVRAVSDWALLRSLRWAYDWSQLRALWRGRSLSPRQPSGGLPPEALVE